MNENIKRTVPWIPVGHPDFKWTSGADVQALWRKHGWTPPSEGRTAPPPPPIVEEPPFAPFLRRFK
jgi:hypothetical protein